MQIIERHAEWRAALDEQRAQGRRVGLVLTMGALHEGHRSLVVQARSECEIVAVTIFINPLQFGQPSDLAAYPVTHEADLDLLRAAGVDLVFIPDTLEVYPTFPERPATTLTVTGAALGMEGDGRPGHFDGMATVVAKLVSVSGPVRAYFGEKDYQQLCVVRQMVADLWLGADVVACPTIREDDGLARSSRNVRLTAQGRRVAPVLFRALGQGVAACARGESVHDIEAAMRAEVATEHGVLLSYAAAVDPVRLRAPETPREGDPVRLLIAAVIDEVRLIDNCAAVFGSGPATAPRSTTAQ